MVSREQVLAQMRGRVHHPAGTRELLQLLKIPREERATFRRHLKSLVSSGDLIQIRGNRFGLPEKMDLHVGRLETHPAGYGFVTPERALEAGGDIYISGSHLNEAMHGDRVVVRIERIKEGGRAEGRVIRILERANESIIGRYDRGDNGMGYVVPFDRRVLMDIFVPPGQEGGASPGEMVSVELTRWPTSTRGAIGRVADVLGDIDAPGVDTEIIIRKFGIPAEACQVHHITEWADGGETDLRNLALLCWTHHRQVDLRMWTIEAAEPKPVHPETHGGTNAETNAEPLWGSTPEPPGSIAGAPSGTGTGSRSGWPANHGAPFTIRPIPRTRWHC